MFSSNPFPQFSSSIHVSPHLNSSIFDLEKNGVYVDHHEHNSNPFVSGDSFFHDPSPPPLNTDHITANTQDTVRKQKQQICEGSGMQYCDDHYDLLESVVFPSMRKMESSKKDGHSKIYTTQGPRDRRVRLSIEIARKFFLLQDMLGFDKASKTLDWLLTKSRMAIKELVEETKHCSSSTVSSDQCEVVFLETINGGSDEDKEQKKSATLMYDDGRRKKMAQKYKSGNHVNNLARDQSRAEARARARERTKEKLRVKKLHHDNKSKKLVPVDYYYCPSNLTLQSSFWSDQTESQSVYRDVLRESTLEQRFSMPYSMPYSYQHNFGESKHSISQVMYTSLPKFTVVHEQQGNHAMI